MGKRFVTIVLAMAWVACGVAPGESDPSEVAGGAVGLLEVDSTRIRALFADYAGMDEDQVLTLLGHERAPFGRCRRLATAAEAEATLDESSVELYDVGQLCVSSPTGATCLSPRTFPRLATIAGVFYASEVPASTSRDAYRFRAEGGSRLGPFEVALSAPARVDELRWVTPSHKARLHAPRAEETSGGPNADTARLAQTDTARIDTAQIDTAQLDLVHGATLRWAGGDPRDTIDIQISTDQETLLCTGPNDGRFHLEPADLATLGLGHAELEVTVKRSIEFDVPGLQHALATVSAPAWFQLKLSRADATATASAPTAE